MPSGGISLIFCALFLFLHPFFAILYFNAENFCVEGWLINIVCLGCIALNIQLLDIC